MSNGPGEGISRGRRKIAEPNGQVRSWAVICRDGQGPIPIPTQLNMYTTPRKQRIGMLAALCVCTHSLHTAWGR